LVADVDFDFDECVTRIRSRDPLTFEVGSAELLPRVRGFVPQLLDELARTPDAYTRGKFIELLGNTQSRAAIPALGRELAHPDLNVRQWAVTALLQICQPEADALIDDYRLRHPEEFE
jgi:HEAT repeat protein